MRLIRKENVSDSIMRYDKNMKDLLLEQSSIGDVAYRFRNLGELIDFSLWTVGDNVLQYARENKDILLTHDKSVLGKYYGWMLFYHFIVQKYIAELSDIKSYAKRLIVFIQKEYHLK